MTNQDDERAETKSELRRALERALWTRAQAGKPDEVTWGIHCWTTKSPPRHAGEVWFRDASGACVKLIFGFKSGAELGEALLDAVERLPVPARPAAASTASARPDPAAQAAQGRLGGIG